MATKPTSTPVPTTTPNPTLEPKPAYKRIPKGYPYTINVPADWQSKVNNADNWAEYVFGDPDSYSATIRVTVGRSGGPLPFDSETLADITLEELEGNSVEDSFQLKERRTLADGGVWLSVSFRKMHLCQREAVALVLVLPRYAFMVEGATCEDEWDEYEILMVEAVESFAFEPGSWR
ncbi:MAG: hypothetical protein OXE17_00605 [Chloroflexi bacterium]|nr:hypothetical protein [Chloroflexota bacterium]